MPLPFAPFVAWLVGIALSWAARDSLVSRDAAVVTTRGFLVSVAFGLAVFAPVCGYFAAFHGDWAYLYLVRSSRVPSAIDLGLVLVASVCVPLGFVIATGASRSRRPERLLRAVSPPLVALVTLFALFGRRLSISASYAQYHGAFGEAAIDKSPLGQGVLLGFVALALGITMSIRAVRRASR